MSDYGRPTEFGTSIVPTKPRSPEACARGDEHRLGKPLLTSETQAGRGLQTNTEIHSCQIIEQSFGFPQIGSRKAFGGSLVSVAQQFASLFHLALLTP